VCGCCVVIDLLAGSTRQGESPTVSLRQLHAGAAVKGSTSLAMKDYVEKIFDPGSQASATCR
jgi:hypothetical protein